LLDCGIVSSLLYVAMNVFAPMQWEGYSPASQAVADLITFNHSDIKADGQMLARLENRRKTASRVMAGYSEAG
jgi:hypothetical protein